MKMNLKYRLYVVNCLQPAISNNSNRPVRLLTGRANAIFFFFVLLFTTSCENELSFNVDDNPSKLIVNTFLDIENDENVITLALTGRESITYVADGAVSIYVNGQMKEQVTTTRQIPDSKGKIKTDYITRLKFNPGELVKVEAKTNDGEHHAWAEVIVPEPAGIHRIDTTIVTLKNPVYDDGYKLIRVKTTFTDSSPERNYYRINLDRILTINTVSEATGRDTVIIYTYPDYMIIREDVVLTDGRPTPINEDDEDLIINPPENRYGVFDNSRIDGEYTMTISVNYNVFPSLIDDQWYLFYNNSETVKYVSADLRVNLHRISETQYYYLKALNIYDSSNYEEALYFPVKFPSNINNGTGVMGISAGISEIIHLYDFIPERYIQ